jgi:hypothetical protein
VLGTLHRNTLIYPGEIKRIVDPEFEISSSVQRVALQNLIAEDWESSATFAEPVVRLREVVFVPGVTPKEATVSGFVVNENDFSLDSIEIQAIVKGAFSIPVAASRTSVFGVAPGAEAPFTVTLKSDFAIPTSISSLFLYTDAIR